MKNVVKERRELRGKKDGAKVWGYENLPLKTKYEHALEITKKEHDFTEIRH
jgi:hypothetical protein